MKTFYGKPVFGGIAIGEIRVLKKKKRMSTEAILTMEKKSWNVLEGQWMRPSGS